MCNVGNNKKAIEKIKVGLQPSGRRVVDFLVDTYPERLTDWISSGELKLIAESRQEEATKLMLRVESDFIKMHRSEDYLTNLQSYYEARAIAREQANQVLFRRL